MHKSRSIDGNELVRLHNYSSEGKIVLAPLSGILGFDTEAQALMIALYIAMDSFGTACNVTGDGAIAIVMQHLYRKSAGTSADN